MVSFREEKVQTRFILPERSEAGVSISGKMGLENSLLSGLQGNGSIHWENLLTGETGIRNWNFPCGGKRRTGRFQAEAIAVAVSGFSLRTGSTGSFRDRCL